MAQFIFGPLLIFINDLAFIVELACKLFADATTLYATTTNVTDSLENLIKYFIERLIPLLEWCSMNRIDINWSKTFFMKVTAKHKSKILIPTTIKIGANYVSVTTEFKLKLITKTRVKLFLNILLINQGPTFR